MACIPLSSIHRQLDCCDAHSLHGDAGIEVSADPQHGNGFFTDNGSWLLDQSLFTRPIFGIVGVSESGMEPVF